tara:strand:+ start:776 stop:1546 length:771 start_codon:yes stop_codon:yes gene_type:complete
MAEETQTQEQAPVENTNTGLLETTQEQVTPDTSQPTTPEQTQADARPEWLPEKFKTGEDLAKSYSELEKKISNHVPKEYDFSVTKEVGLADFPEDLTKEVTDVFKKANFSQGQVKTALALYSDQLAKIQDQMQNAPRTDLSKEESALKTQWGDQYENRLQAVKKFANTLPERVLNVPLVDSAEGIMYLEQIMEAGRMPNPIQNNTVIGKQDPIEIREEIQKMRGDPKMKLPPGDPLGDAHQQRLYALYEKLDRLEK